MTVDWKFRTKRWNAYKLGQVHAKNQRPHNDKVVEEQFRKSYDDGYKSIVGKVHNDF